MGISWGGALPVAKLIKDRATPALRMIKEIDKLVQPVYSVLYSNRIRLQGEW